MKDEKEGVCPAMAMMALVMFIIFLGLMSVKACGDPIEMDDVENQM